MKMDEQFKKELEKTNKFVDKVYDKMNLFPNPDPEINETIAMGLTNNKIKHGLRYCPCFIVQGETKEEKRKADNRVCPCKPALVKELPEDGIWVWVLVVIEICYKLYFLLFYSEFL